MKVNNIFTWPPQVLAATFGVLLCFFLGNKNQTNKWRKTWLNFSERGEGGVLLEKGLRSKRSIECVNKFLPVDRV